MFVRDADIEGDREQLLGFLGHYLPAHGDGRYYDWLYRGNPDGPARAFLLEEPEHGTIGIAAAFPRRVRVRGTVVLAWNLGDFAIRPEFRTLGPALKLQRACLAAVASGDLALAYDHPSCAMMAIYDRMRLGTAGRVVRYAKPVRVERRVAQSVRPAVLARALASVANGALVAVELARRSRGPHRVSAYGGRFDERADALDAELGLRYGIAGVRTARYLNWRYLDHPLRRYEVLVVEAGSQWLGYTVYRWTEEGLLLAELVTRGDEGVASALLSALTVAARRARVPAVSAPALADSPLVPLLRRRGFFARESVPFVVSTRAGGSWDGVVTDLHSWLLTDGDRDG